VQRVLTVQLTVPANPVVTAPRAATRLTVGRTAMVTNCAIVVRLVVTRAATARLDHAPLTAQLPDHQVQPQIKMLS